MWPSEKYGVLSSSEAPLKTKSYFLLHRVDLYFLYLAKYRGKPTMKSERGREERQRRQSGVLQAALNPLTQQVTDQDSLRASQEPQEVG